MESELAAVARTALVAFAALLPITNPPGNAPIFLALTRGLSEGERRAMARRVGINCLALLVAAAFVGTYVLGFFGISLSVVRVGGGILVAATAWRLLAAEADAGRDSLAAPGREAEQLAGRAFYPLAFPITVGPGSISIAITLGASVPVKGVPLVTTSLGLVLGIWAATAVIWLSYRYASRMVRLLGPTGTAVFLRLSAFILLCIGVQICWDGLSDLLAPWRPAGR